MENFSKYKILILGYLEAKSIDTYINLASEYGISNSVFEFITDPENFDMGMIRSSDYTDLFLSCVPHNIKGSHDKNLIRQVKKHPELYPKLQTTAQSGINFKPLSLTQFEKFLINSKYFAVIGLTPIKRNREMKVETKPVQAASDPSIRKKPRNGTSYKNFLKKLTDDYS